MLQKISDVLAWYKMGWAIHNRWHHWLLYALLIATSVVYLYQGLYFIAFVFFMLLWIEAELNATRGWYKLFRDLLQGIVEQVDEAKKDHAKRVLYSETQGQKERE